MRIIFNFLLFFCVSTIIANSQQSNSDKLYVFKKDTLVVSITDNPSTGYSWRYDKSVKIKNVKYLGDSFLQNEQGLIGAAGTRNFKFLAKKTGEVILKFYKSRGEQAPVETKEYNVVIQKKAKSSQQ